MQRSTGSIKQQLLYDSSPPSHGNRNTLQQQLTNYLATHGRANNPNFDEHNRVISLEKKKAPRPDPVPREWVNGDWVPANPTSQNKRSLDDSSDQNSRKKPRQSSPAGADLSVTRLVPNGDIGLSQMQDLVEQSRTPSSEAQSEQGTKDVEIQRYLVTEAKRIARLAAPDIYGEQSLKKLIAPVISKRAPSECSDHTEDSLGNDPSEHVSEKVSSVVEALQAENMSLKSELANLRSVLYPPEIPPRQRTVHRVTCDCQVPSKTSLYDDAPSFVGIGYSNHMAGRSSLRYDTVDVHESYGKNIVLVVFKQYRCSSHPFLAKGEARSSQIRKMEMLDPEQIGESMMIIGDDTQRAFGTILSEAGVSDQISSKINNKEISAPYVFFYQQRKTLRACAASEAFESHKSVRVVMDYLDAFEEQFTHADEMTKKGLVSLSTIHYLFKPNEIIVGGPLSSDSLGFCTESYLENGSNARSFRIKAWHWCFDGSFWRQYRTLKFEFPKDQEAISITQLQFLPLECAPKDFQENLQHRGLELWKCHKMRYVKYDSKSPYDVQMNDLRFIVDYRIWKAQQQQKKQHQQQQQQQREQQDPDDTTTPLEKREYIPADVLASEPRNEAFWYLLPSTVLGFDMLNKTWRTLNVSGISDVKWNKKAFESLVVDVDTKEFIQALVTQQMSVDRSTDLIEGKGNSLVILLHGGPGTGKTLTAESVAELAEKPLYRVTCGDIGTDPVNVEKHLQGVLYLGKTWGCVVLLDEADIFLEERRSHDLSRNALVSVFLRALEYYDGILILTTNRVGTFDEAFKSRIQLSVRYNNLTEKQRLLIWENFFKRLEDIDDEHVDVNDLRRNGRELARHKMNGRQIRNSLTNARQLASYKNERMDISHLRRAIDVFIKFEEYTKEIKQGITDDDIARECGVR